jgi:hypothetical protein
MKTKKEIEAELKRQWDIYNEALKEIPLTNENAVKAIKASATIKALNWVLGIGEIK